jgi:hypothetical protein
MTPTVTPTNTVTPSVTRTATPTITPTNTNTPTNTTTPTITPSPSSAAYYAYIFAEPQDSGDANTLLTWASGNGAVEWGDYYDSSVPNNGGGNYSNDLDVYAHQPSFINGGGNFVQPSLLRAPILQTSGTYSGCSQSQYTFGSIAVAPSVVNTAIPYFYTIWLPLDGVGGTLNNMVFDLGTSLCGNEIYNDISPTPGLIVLDVIVTSGAAIPAGTYRVMWASPNLLLPATPPLTVTYYFRGESKS